MTNVRTQYREAYAPRTISKAFLRALVEALVDFKPGLPTRSRKIRAKAISAGKITELEGPESWKVTDPHSLAELEHVRVELLLTSAEHSSCELHVTRSHRFKEQIVIAIQSDIGAIAVVAYSRIRLHVRLADLLGAVSRRIIADQQNKVPESLRKQRIEAFREKAFAVVDGNANRH